MCKLAWRALQLCALIAMLDVSVSAATLEQLTVDEMAEKATLIVRGRVGACTGEARGALIYTRCALSVTERWKGSAGAQIDFYIPGGTAMGLRQVFSGAPAVGPGEEYVLFLWAGRSGINQLIGLSQGLFSLKADAKGQPTASREATSELMLDKDGRPVQDSPVELRVSELRSRVQKALATREKR